MFFVGQSVHHMQAPGRRGKVDKDSLRKRPDYDGVDPALEVSGDVGNGFALAERDVRLQRHDLTAQLADRDLERRSRA